MNFSFRVNDPHLDHVLANAEMAPCFASGRKCSFSVRTFC